MDEIGLRQLFDFKRGVPSVHGIMFGDIAEEGREMEHKLNERNLIDGEEKLLLVEYDMKISCVHNDGKTIDCIYVEMPLHKVTPNDVKDLYRFFSNKMEYTERNALYTYNDEGELIDVNVYVEDEYFEVSLSIENDTISIIIETKQDDCQLYQVLAYMARKGNNDMLWYVDNMITSPYLNNIELPINRKEHVNSNR